MASSVRGGRRGEVGVAVDDDVLPEVVGRHVQRGSRVAAEVAGLGPAVGHRDPHDAVVAEVIRDVRQLRPPVGLDRRQHAPLPCEPTNASAVLKSMMSDLPSWRRQAGTGRAQRTAGHGAPRGRGVGRARRRRGSRRGTRRRRRRRRRSCRGRRRHRGTGTPEDAPPAGRSSTGSAPCLTTSSRGAHDSEQRGLRGRRQHHIGVEARPPASRSARRRTPTPPPPTTRPG